jgi:hypothetical protein
LLFSKSGLLGTPNSVLNLKAKINVRLTDTHLLRRQLFASMHTD